MIDTKRKCIHAQFVLPRINKIHKKKKNKKKIQVMFSPLPKGEVSLPPRQLDLPLALSREHTGMEKYSQIHTRYCFL